MRTVAVGWKFEFTMRLKDAAARFEEQLKEFLDNKATYKLVTSYEINACLNTA